MTVSVAMAAYNGEKYIREQIESIICQLSIEDELIISDDGSKDGTIDIIKRFCSQYPQIQLIKGPGQGAVRNFENAILHCNKEIILLSDQDDIWMEDKVPVIKDFFLRNRNMNVLLHDACIMNGNTPTSDSLFRYRKGFLINWLKSAYWGCCMAFRRQYIVKYLPFRGRCIAHDQMIGLFGEADHCSYHIDHVLCFHRVHGSNVTQDQSFRNKIIFRIQMLEGYISCRR